MKEDENTMKARIVGNRVLAMFALQGALICLHYAYASSGWQEYAWAIGMGLLVPIVINHTVKASILSSAMVLGETLETMAKKGMFR